MPIDRSRARGAAARQGAKQHGMTRPSTVTGAAISAFLAAASYSLLPLGFMINEICDLVRYHRNFHSWYFDENSGAVLNSVLVVLFVWGAARAWRGITSKTLFWTALTSATLMVAQAIYFAVVPWESQPHIGDGGAFPLVAAGPENILAFPAIVNPLIVVVLLLARSSRNFFHRRNATLVT
jgi:hypothetical protein